MNTMTIELKLSPEQATQLDEVARSRHIAIDETIHLAVAEWLEEQYRLSQARLAMRKLGEGIGNGKPPQDGARNHDSYLYRQPQP